MSDKPTADFIGSTPVGAAIHLGRLVDAAGRLYARGPIICLISGF